MPYLFLYLVKVIICSAVLYGYYYFFLRNKVYHAYNRFYLLGVVLISTLCPLINLNIFLADENGGAKPIQLLQVVTNSNVYLEELVLQSQVPKVSIQQVLLLGYGSVSLVLLAMLLKLMANIFFLLKTSSARKLNDITFIQSDSKGTPFSFFRFIFWNPAIDINSPTGQQIFAHEVAHVREQHSLDKLFLNIVLVVCWINPIFWIIRKELNLIHEFIADKKAVANNDAQALAAMIVTSAYPKHAYLLTNHFFYSPIKRRLQMLSKYKSKKAGYFYRVLALPIALLIVAAISIKAKNKVDGILHPEKTITVVLDAGHGGRDNGALSADGNKYEKDIALEYIKAIKNYNQSPNIRIVLTRESDVYQSPKEKTDFARNFAPDLFISIHAGGATGAAANKSGMDVYVSREHYTNSYTSKLFASSVIQQFKQNYGLSVAPNPIQREVGIHVVQGNDCPSILIEAGYLTNKKDLAYLETSAAKETFAKNILAAIAAYADEIGRQPQATVTMQKDTVPVYPKLPTHYKGKKIRRLYVTEKDEQVSLTFFDGTSMRMTKEEAEKLNLLPPPPPPPPAAPAAPPAPPAPPVMADRMTTPAPPPPPVPAAPPAPPAPPRAPVKNKNVNKNRNVDITKTTPVVEPVVLDTKVDVSLVTPTAQPLVIIDKLEVEYSEIKKLNPNDIDHINVLKGAEAIKKYGDKKTVNGVIEITTKTNVITKVETKISAKEKISENKP